MLLAIRSYFPVTQNSKRSRLRVGPLVTDSRGIGALMNVESFSSGSSTDGVQRKPWHIWIHVVGNDNSWRRTQVPRAVVNRRVPANIARCVNFWCRTRRTVRRGCRCWSSSCDGDPRESKLKSGPRELGESTISPKWKYSYTLFVWVTKLFCNCNFPQIKICFCMSNLWRHRQELSCIV